MGRKALVDYSLIKEICDNLTSSKKKFKGQLDLDQENGPAKAGTKTEEVKRLLVSGAKKKNASPARKKAKKNQARNKSPVRFRQNASSHGESDSSSNYSDTSSECDSDQDTNLNEEHFSECNSDENSDTAGEIE